jgi:alpha-mannosidase
MKKKYLIILGLVSPVWLFSQPLEKREQYDLAKDKVLYSVGYAHLDTEWNWDYPTTIDKWIKNLMTENFHLFEKYPDYVFNFTGSRRYQMMKEYYPELYQKVIQYVKQGRWNISGSSVDEAEVNISSSESIVRQILYGNNYFRKEFGTESKDILLPDCFGFIANAPSIWNHCGMLGFATQKLQWPWNPANPIPFNVGVWNGPDGKGVIAALHTSGYTSHVVPRLDRDSAWNARIEENKTHGYSFDFSFYGVGDMGGAPREKDVKNAEGSIRNSDGKFKVILAPSDQLYKDVTPEIRKQLPVYSGDLLLVEHSAGSLTSNAFMKRINRKNELLAQSAEQAAVIADWSAGADYPFEKLNNSWNLLLGSQFHDILPGTAFPKAYEYAWNDEFVAGNGFAAVLKNSLSALSHNLNTRVKNRAVVVYNPIAMDREDVATMDLEYSQLPDNVQVFDQKGKEVPSQVIERKDHQLKIVFLAKVPSVGLAVFDVRETNQKQASNTSLSVTSTSLENEYYKVKLADNGDIISVFDKKAKKELLAKPAGLEFQEEAPRAFPSWNMDWKDRQKPPIGFMNEDVSVSIAEQGPVRVALLVKRKGRNSEISQIYSLATGEAGKHLEVTNKIDWQSKEVSLKAAFPLTVHNENATYNLGVGAIERSTNNARKFEVPSKQWFDLTDVSGRYGVSVLEDCKYGSDKPDSSTLRLTLLYTPQANSYVYQGTQDWGIHDFRYGLYGHTGDWRKGQSPWQAQFFNQPLLAFEAPEHDGGFGKSVSLLKINSPQVGLMAFKKTEQGEYYLIRVNELYGKDAKGIQIQLPGKITEAFEVNGQEQRIGDVSFANGKLNFDITHYTIRSFAVKLEPFSGPSVKPVQSSVIALPYNLDAISFDDNRDDGNLVRGLSLPGELIPKEIISEDIHFKMGNTADGENNAVVCDGQKIDLPEGDFNKLYILASAMEDTQGDFIVDGQPSGLSIREWTGYTGQFYKRELTPDMKGVIRINNPYFKQDNIAWFASHRHIAYPSENDAYQYSYLCKYEINIPKGAKTLQLPGNKKIRVFAITAVRDDRDTIKILRPLYDDFKNSQPVQLRN